jgi:hypothetical protein
MGLKEKWNDIFLFFIGMGVMLWIKGVICWGSSVACTPARESDGCLSGHGQFIEEIVLK